MSYFNSEEMPNVKMPQGYTLFQGWDWISWRLSQSGGISEVSAEMQPFRIPTPTTREEQCNFSWETTMENP